MFDKEFLKTLTIMYVEDDESIRGSLSSILTKVFKEVIICNDGDEALEAFKSYTLDKHIKIDAIVSDINMPNMNGIEFIMAVREFDSSLPVIFTTAHGEANYLMDAIKLKIAYYALKPIDTTELLENISKFCMIEHNKQLIENKTAQISSYMDIMNHISSIFKVDIDGNITESNYLLTDISEYSEEELLSMKIDKILHKDAFVTNYSDIVEIVQKNNVYKGKLKFSAKSGRTFYLNTTIMPLFNDSTNQVEGYLYIGFDQTNDELEKQKTMQRVRKNIMDQRSKESQLINQIKELENQIVVIKRNTLSSKDTKLIMDKLAKEKQKTSTLNTQIEHYEQEIMNLTKQKDAIVSSDRGRNEAMLKKKQEHSKENQLLQTKIIELQAKIHKLEATNDSSYVD